MSHLLPHFGKERPKLPARRLPTKKREPLLSGEEEVKREKEAQNLKPSPPTAARNVNKEAAKSLVEEMKKKQEEEAKRKQEAELKKVQDEEGKKKQELEDGDDEKAAGVGEGKKGRGCK